MTDEQAKHDLDLIEYCASLELSRLNNLDQI